MTNRRSPRAIMWRHMSTETEQETRAHGRKAIARVPFVAPLPRPGAAAGSPDAIPGLVADGLAAGMAPDSGPTFLDFPMDQVFSEGSEGDADGVLHDVLSEPVASGDVEKVM